MLLGETGIKLEYRKFQPRKTDEVLIKILDKISCIDNVGKGIE